MTRRALELPLLIALCAAGFVAGLCAAPAPAAPVPKQKAPEKLTPAMVTGTWLYAWGGWPDGVIAFAADGSFIAQHVPGSETYYVGSWSVKDDTVTLYEAVWHPDTEWPSGPYTRYDFKFGLDGYPTLAGKSNGSTNVKLWNRK